MIGQKSKLEERKKSSKGAFRLIGRLQRGTRHDGSLRAELASASPGALILPRTH